MEQATMSESEYENRSIEYHEAGHATAFFFLGMTIKKIVIDNQNGRVHPRNTDKELYDTAQNRKDTQSADTYAKRIGFMYYVGPAAEAKFQGIMACEAPYQTHMLSDEALRQQYVRLVAKRHLFRILLPGQEFIDNSDHVQASCYFNEENCNRRQWRVVKYAIEFVFKEQMWKIIEALATQLRGRGEMQGCEAQKIMQTALGEDSTPMVVIP